MARSQSSRGVKAHPREASLRPVDAIELVRLVQKVPDINLRVKILIAAGLIDQDLERGVAEIMTGSEDDEE